jgi:hypothetical protein
MKALRAISITLGVLFIISAITGVRHMEWSSEGFSYKMQTPLLRACTFVLGLIFLCWHVGIGRKSNSGLWVTTVLFYVAICQVIYQGFQYALSVASTDTFGAVWAIVSQLGVAAILYLVLRRIKKSWKTQPDVAKAGKTALL